jgi:hypothetical protein
MEQDPDLNEPPTFGIKSPLPIFIRTVKYYNAFCDIKEITKGIIFYAKAPSTVSNYH